MNRKYIEQYKNLGLNISFYRRKNGLTQMQLATVGVSLDVIFKMCDELSVLPKDLFDFRG